MAAPAPARLETLVRSFRELQGSGAMEGLWRLRWGREQEALALLQEERVRTLTLAEAETLHRSLPVSQRRRREFLGNTIEQVREALWFLLYEQAPYEVRVWEVLDEGGGYRLRGADLCVVSALLGVHQPTSFGLADAMSIRALRRLGLLRPFAGNESYAGRFQKVQEALWRLRALAGFQDFQETDIFLGALARGMLSA
ncbi:MAG: hypothetical protein HY535_06640 [Chloroflexi bacterium]|nr:hypothetical protein [Chloroflexota bacterium]